MGALPYEDDTFDIVLSLNGFHAFPDKEAAYREVFRVLKPRGTFCGCFYVAGEQKRTDRFVRHIYEKAGFFTPPYETTASLKKRLEKRYATVTTGNREEYGMVRLSERKSMKACKCCLDRRRLLR